MPFLKNLLVDRLGRRHDAFGWREHETPIPMDAVRTICLLQTDAKLGDAIVNSLIVDGLRQARPEIEVTVGTTAGFVRYWESHPGVKRAVSFPDRDRGNPLARLRASRGAAASWRGAFDALVSFDSYAFFDTFALIRALEPKKVVGFNKQPYRLFDVSLDDGRHGLQRKHISERVRWTLRAFGIERSLTDLRFHLPYGPEEEAEVGRIADPVASKGPRLLLNSYGAASNRSLTPESVGKALSALDWPGPVFLSVPRGQEAAFADLGSNVVPFAGLSGFAALFAMVERMDAVVSPDSAVAHIAAGFDKPQVCLFRDRVYNPVVWRPMSDRCEIVLSTTGENVNDLDWTEFALAARRAFSEGYAR